jgi:hypothetical protein
MYSTHVMVAGSVSAIPARVSNSGSVLVRIVACTQAVKLCITNTTALNSGPAAACTATLLRVYSTSSKCRQQAEPYCARYTHTMYTCAATVFCVVNTDCEVELILVEPGAELLRGVAVPLM